MKRGGPSLRLAIIFLTLLAGAAAFPSTADTATEGRRLFGENKPEAAIPLLEQAVKDSGVDEAAWLWLAACYQQLGRVDDGIAALRKGLAKSTTKKQLYYYNLGCLFSIQGKSTFAKDMFDSAISADASFAPAWLNRANAEILLQDLRSAREDYGRYLDLAPSSPQIPDIEALMVRLEGAISAEDQRRAAVEAARIAEELARKNLLDEVTASLRAAAEDTTNLAAGSGQVQGYGDELLPSD
ncbi:MAG: tetratricopeptide repeat protein [Spirochaetota bacterium]